MAAEALIAGLGRPPRPSTLLHSFDRLRNLQPASQRALLSTRISPITFNPTSSIPRSLRIPSRRSYHISTSLLSQSTQSSPLGSVGEGEAGTADTITSTSALLPDENMNEAERAIWEKLNRELKGVKELEVQDVSGGCGSMYRIEVAAEEFKGMNMLKQQRRVNSVLKEEVKGWHGVQLRTRGV